MVQGKEPSDPNKISACRCVLDKALAYTDTLDIITRLEALETAHSTGGDMITIEYDDGTTLRCSLADALYPDPDAPEKTIIAAHADHDPSGLFTAIINAVLLTEPDGQAEGYA